MKDNTDSDNYRTKLECILTSRNATLRVRVGKEVNKEGNGGVPVEEVVSVVSGSVVLTPYVRGLSSGRRWLACRIV